METANQLLTISEVSKRSGVAASALRFYESKSMIHSQRAGSGHRRYPRAALRRIAFIVFAQRIGLTLGEIAEELAKLPQNRAPEGEEWKALRNVGRHGSINRSFSCNAYEVGYLSALVVAACRWNRADLRTLETVLLDKVPALVTGLYHLAKGRKTCA